MKVRVFFSVEYAIDLEVDETKENVNAHIRNLDVYDLLPNATKLSSDGIYDWEEVTPEHKPLEEPKAIAHDLEGCWWEWATSTSINLHCYCGFRRYGMAAIAMPTNCPYCGHKVLGERPLL